MWHRWSGGLAVLLLAVSAFAGEGAAKPNVLFINIDDLSAVLGCYGHAQVKSPNLDRLAKQGMRFDRAYCQYSVCNPSRTSYLTGLRPDRTGVMDNNTPFRTKLPDVKTLPQWFRERGYFTARLGKIFHATQEFDDPNAWDFVKYPEGTREGAKGEGRNLTGGTLKWCRWTAAEGEDEDQADGISAREAIRLLEEKRDKPFFLAVGFHKPHDPFVAPKKYFDLYPVDQLKLARDPDGRSPDLPLALGGGAFAAAFDKFTDAERREFMRAYYAGVSFMDAQLGKVLEALERLKLTDNTIIMALGDNGYHLGERGWWNKNTLFELSARCPLMVYAPGMKAPGRSCARLVEFVDLFPTLTDLCGLSAPDGLQGKSFRPLLDDPEQPWKAAAYTVVKRGQGIGRSVRTERWRYTEWVDGREGAELYDHQNDTGEYHNLVKDERYAKTVAELKELLKAGEK